MKQRSNPPEPQAKKNRDRIIQTPEQIRDDWEFLKAWMRGDLVDPDVPDRRMELLFCHHITGLFPRSALFSPVLASLARQKQNQLLCALRFGAIFEKIAGLCQQQHIRILPLKGVALSLTLHASDPGRRQMSDIDILVRPEDLAGLASILATLGYTVKNPGMLTAEYQANKKKVEFEPTTAGDPGLDVHTAFIVKKFLGAHAELPLADVFQRARTTQGTRHQIEILDPLDEWLYLAYHFCLHHRFAGLKWLDDLHSAAVKFSVTEMALLRQRAAEAGLTTVVNAVLELIVRVYGPPDQLSPMYVPPPSFDKTVWVWLEDAFTPQKLMRRDLEHGQGNLLDQLGTYLWEFLFIDNRKQRRLALVRFIFIKREILSTIIGPVAKPFYLVVAPIFAALTSCLVLFFTFETLRRLVRRRK